MLNHVDLIGRLTREPELRYTASGKAVTTVSVACDRTFGEGVDFPEVIVWGKDAENLCKYLRQGSLVAVEGHIQTRSWVDEKNTKHYRTEVVAERVHFLPSSRKQEGAASERSEPLPSAKELPPEEELASDAELPF